MAPFPPAPPVPARGFSLPPESGARVAPGVGAADGGAPTLPETAHALAAWFSHNGFAPVETPQILPAPAPEEFIDAVPAPGGGWWRTSPELEMKMLLAGGSGPIFQIGPCCRAEEEGPWHRSCFTMLEWYRPDAGSAEMMADTQALLESAARALTGGTDADFNGSRVSLAARDWDVLEVSEAFRRFAGWDPAEDFDRDRFDLDLVDKVEPSLPRDRPVALAGYPAQLASLARLRENPSGGPPVADRWEVYVGGCELANAYGELTDPAEQRQRFAAANAFRAGRGKSTYPLREDFLAALGNMPPSGGIALGVDRLDMILHGRTAI
ncbi:MAG: EF-P lysine aminoacylase GenX [Kiritimatiellae bacterium]|nr:EF-P lysine aminoacylase GenX [Kiritimatiellia bacterium]